MFCVSVKLAEKNDVNQSQSNFCLHVSHNTNNTWEVERSLDEFQQLNKDLSSNESVNVPALPEGCDEESLNAYLAKLLSQLTEEQLWNTKSLLHFLDNKPSTLSKISELYITLMQRQVDELKTQNALYNKKLDDLSSAYDRLQSVVSVLAASPAVNSTSSVPLSVANVASALPRVKSGGDLVNRTSPKPPGLALSLPGSASSRSFTPVTSVNSGRQHEDNESAGSLTTRGSEGMSAYLQPHRASSSVSPSPTFVFTRSNSDQIVPSASAGLDTVNEEHHSSSNEATEPGTPCPFEEAVAELVDMLSPHESQTLYRNSVSGLVRKQSKLCMPQSAAFDVGLHALGCQLPDDSQALTLVFSASNAPNWHKVVLSRLVMVVERSAAAGGYFPAKFEVENGSSVDDYHPAANHQLNNVHYSDVNSLALSAQSPTVASGSLKSTVPVSPLAQSQASAQHIDSQFRVHCVVDAMSVDLLPNARNELVLLAFLEEVSELVGQDNLFKRSLLLIRAWWVYETMNYVGSSIKHYLSDSAVAVMVASLFNVHHTVITSPLSALGAFLRVYSKYDGFTEAITMQGVVPYHVCGKQAGLPVNQLTLLPPTDKHLVSAAVLDKYYRMVTVADGVEGGAVMSGVAPNLYGTPLGHVDGLEKVEGVETAVSPPTNATAMTVSVERNGYTCLSPFTLTNLVSEKMTTRRVVLVHRAFQIGSFNLAAITNKKTAAQSQQAEAESGAAGNAGAASVAADASVTTTAESVAIVQRSEASDAEIKSFFPASVARFKDSWRPDAVANTTELQPGAASLPVETLSLKERLLQQIQHCNFVQVGVVTEEVLVHIVTEALLVRGPLPVGEVGKTITDLAGANNSGQLSHRLRELFGGLKKLLEKYSDLFVVASNHQFNPHVCLRSTLSAEQVMALEAGAFVAEVFAKPVKGGKQTPPERAFMHSPLTASNLSLYANNNGGVDSYGGNTSMRSESPLSAAHQLQQLQSISAGNANQQQSQQPNYNAALSYNVNTSMDRRMRQQQINGVTPPLPVSARLMQAQQYHNNKQQNNYMQNVGGGQQFGQQQMNKRGGGGIGGGNVNQHQQHRQQVKAMQAEKQYQHQMQLQQLQMMQQRNQGGLGHVASDSNNDWNDFETPQQQPVVKLSRSQAWQLQMQQNQQQNMLRGGAMARGDASSRLGGYATSQQTALGVGGGKNNGMISAESMLLSSGRRGQQSEGLLGAGASYFQTADEDDYQPQRQSKQQLYLDNNDASADIDYLNLSGGGKQHGAGGIVLDSSLWADGYVQGGEGDNEQQRHLGVFFGSSLLSSTASDAAGDDDNTAASGSKLLSQQYAKAVSAPRYLQTTRK